MLKIKELLAKILQELIARKKVFYGTCNTAAATAEKEVTCPEFTSSDLVKGAVIFVTFTATNTAAVADLNLNVNGTGNKRLYQLINTTYGNLSSAGQLRQNQTYCFHYDGSAWVTIFNYNSTYSNMSQTEASAGTATSARSISAKVLSTTIEEKISDLVNSFYQASPSAATSCSAGTLTQVKLVTAGAVSNGSGFSVSYNGIKITTAGKYRISAGYSVSGMAAGISKVSFTIRKGSVFSGSSIVHQLTITTPGNSASWTSVFNVSSKIVELAANDILFLGANFTGGAGTVAGSTDTYLLIERVA